jgi:4-amino-4-deoxy-L-arabinose transferase-like glycosyltransferase
MHTLVFLKLLKHTGYIMSDFSDSSKSQKKTKPTEEQPTGAEQQDAIDTPLEQEEHTDTEPVLSEESTTTNAPSEKEITAASPIEQDNQPEQADEAPQADTPAEAEKTDDMQSHESSEETVDAEVVSAPKDAQENEATSSEEPSAALSVEKDDDVHDTDDELIGAAASKLSSRFGKKSNEPAQPEAETVESKETPPMHGTVSAEVPPKRKPAKKKKEKKPKEPLPDVAPESKILNTLSLIPILPLLIFAALQGGVALFFRELWPLQEVQTVAVVQDTLAASNWLTPILDGAPYSSAMPLYYWFSSIIALIPDIPINFAIKASTVISSVLFVLSTYLFARAAGVSKKTGLAAGMLTMSAVIPAVTIQLNGMETLFAALVTFSHAAFVMGWKQQRSYFWLAAGFICAAAATLTAGFPGLFIPLFSILFISCWRKRPTRFGEWDVAGGFGVYLIIVLSWFAYVYFAVQPEYLLNLVPNVLAAPFKGALAHLPYWWHMLSILPLILLPWLVVVLVLPWTKIASISLYKNILATRNPENIGTAYLWLSAVITCAMYCFLDYMTPVWLLVLLPQLAILAARAIKNFSPLRNTIFYRLIALVFFAAGITLIGLVNFTQFIPFEINGWMYLSAIMLATAGIFWLRAPWNSRLGTVGLALAVTILLQPVFIMSASTINEAISAKDISMTMEEYAEKNFAPVVYNADPAPFAYFVRKPVKHAFDLHTLSTILNTNKDVVIIMSATDWDNWLTKPETLKLVDTQHTPIPHLGKGFILAIQEKSAGNYRPEPQVQPEEEPSVNEPETPPATEEQPASPAEEEPATDSPQTDNEDEPAPLKRPILEETTTAESTETAPEPETDEPAQVEQVSQVAQPAPVTQEPVTE